MTHAIETLEYNNHKITVFYDEDAESPREYDNLGTLVIFSRPYRHLSDKGKEPGCDLEEYIEGFLGEDRCLESIDALLNKIPSYLHPKSYEWLPKPDYSRRHAKLTTIRKKVITQYIDRHLQILGVNVYEHGGIMLRSSPFSLDSSYDGIIYTRDKDVSTESLASEVEEYSSYLLGERYLVEVTRPTTCACCGQEVPEFDPFVDSVGDFDTIEAAIEHGKYIVDTELNP